MTDLSSLSDADLKALYAQSAAPQSADLSSLSDEQLMQAYRSTAPAASEPAGPERTIPQEIGRQAGLAGRAVVQGVAALPMMAMDAGVAARNLVTNLSHGVTPNLADFNPFAKEGGTPQPYELPSRTFNKALTQVGVPEPQTATEKVTGFIESVLSGSRIAAPQAAKTPGADPLLARVKSSDPVRTVSASYKPPTVKEATLQTAQKEGYVVPPSTTNPTVANRALEGAAGKITTAQLASIKNQGVTNRLARQALGLANDTPLTPTTMASLRANAGRVYESISNAGEITADGQYLDDLAQIGKGVDEIKASFPNANVGASKEIDTLVNSLLQDKFSSRAALAYLKELRKSASANLSFVAGGDPAKQALGMAQREAASTLEDLILRHLSANGDEALATSFDQARRLIAISHTVENALNESTGNVSASALAKNLKSGKPLASELAVAAKFAQAFPKAAKEVTESMPGISPLDYYGAIGAAGLFSSPHLLLLPALRMGIRNALLTPSGQKLATAAPQVAGEAPQTLGVPLSAAMQATQ